MGEWYERHEEDGGCHGKSLPPAFRLLVGVAVHLRRHHVPQVTEHRRQQLVAHVHAQLAHKHRRAGADLFALSGATVETALQKACTKTDQKIDFTGLLN